MIEKEKAKMKAEEIKNILAPLLKQKLNQKAKVEERSGGGNRRYYKVTWSKLGGRTFASVDMGGHLVVHKSPSKHSIAFEYHIEKLRKKGFEIGEDIHGNVDNRYVEWNISNLEGFVKLQFEYYSQGM